MEKPDVSSLLGGLEPTTEYAEFLKLWPHISDALGRQVKLKAIYEALAKENVLTISYVTFTRFVKKKKAEGEEANTPRSQQPRKESGMPLRESSHAAADSDRSEPAKPETENSDKSERVATPAAEALQEAQRVSTSKNYAKNVRNRQT